MDDEIEVGLEDAHVGEDLVGEVEPGLVCSVEGLDDPLDF